MELPPGTWDGYDYTGINAVILFADLEHSVMISSALSPPDYDRLINAFQATMYGLLDKLREQQMRVAEATIAGDQLCIFFYDPDDVRRNFELDGPQRADGERRAALISELREGAQQAMFAAFRAAIQIKNAWFVQDTNVERVDYYREPLNLAIGLHTGRVYLGRRADGKLRIEGNAVNIGKRIEGASRQGQYSRIMFSQRARDVLRGSVVRHSQLRQRIFFERQRADLELLKGVVAQEYVYEMKFYHRLPVPVEQQVYELYEKVFKKDRTNLWAYYQLFDYYAYVLQDWNRAFTLAKLAHLVRPEDEKVLVDMSRCYFKQGQLAQAKQFAEQALARNAEFDLACEYLAEIAARQDDLPAQTLYFRRALALSPDSPLYNMNLGLALLSAGELDEAAVCIRSALRLYPDYLQQPGGQAALREAVGDQPVPEDIAALAAG